MNGKSYSLKVITTEKVFYEGNVVSAVIPGEVGYLGVLANHAPLVTTCVPGELYFRDAQGMEYRYKAGKGFLEILGNHVTFLTDKVLGSKEINE